ncbi:hypothetical protein N7532_009408 [Penicillium argentinense]|uniref:Uncharacterized protein n=1 Tax=Penicillium argentinense TaxID=1131581 RepID=A0A9W9EZ73_9EURO|nr:uncharacterized protein N7532_009408 [Penicillium argentinense]KAJ5090724.1 hypothetical protein N7532_009408 [Penicillium argentinense]
MPTQLDRALNSKIDGSKYLTHPTPGFAGMVTAVAAWSIWGTDVFPAEEDPTGSKLLSEFKYSLYKKRRCVIECILMTKDPENWTEDELRRWLRARALLPSENATREDLLERVKANMRIPRTSQSAATK